MAFIMVLGGIPGIEKCSKISTEPNLKHLRGEWGTFVNKTSSAKKASKNLLAVSTCNLSYSEYPIYKAHSYIMKNSQFWGNRRSFMF